MAEFTTFISGLSFAECPRWRDGRLLVSDFYIHRVLAVTMDGSLETIESVHGVQYRLDGGGAKPELAEQTLLRLARNRRFECFN